VWVEAGAGAQAGYDDAAYVKVGATVTAARSELFQDAGVLAWVKPPADLDRVLSELPSGCTIIGLTHPFHDDTVARAAERLNLRLESVELLAEQEILPAQDALAAMSRFAGRIALAEALDLRARLGHHGPQRVLVIGAGHAGLQAAQLAAISGQSVAVASTGRSRRQEAGQWPDVAYYDIPAAAGAGGAGAIGQDGALRQVIASSRPEVIIAAVKHRGEACPCLLPAETLSSLPAGTVVVDLSASRGGSVADSQVDRQWETDNGVWICNRSNYPNAEPAEASSAYAACLVNVLSGAGV
jgi:NAD(P) transhydrogenase subunit alpha